MICFCRLMDPMQQNQNCSFSPRLSDPLSVAMSPASGLSSLPPPSLCPAPVPRTQQPVAAARAIQLSPEVAEVAGGPELCLPPPFSISRPRPTALGMGSAAGKTLKNPESIPRPKAASAPPLPAGPPGSLGHHTSMTPESPQPLCPPSSRSPQANRSPQTSPSCRSPQAPLILPPSSATFPHHSSQPSASATPAKGLNVQPGIIPPPVSQPKPGQSYRSSQLRVSPEPQPAVSEGTKGKPDKASTDTDDFR